MRKQAFMIVIMVLIIVASSAEAAAYSGGAGTEANPYQIGNASDWITLSATIADWDKHFIVTADIDFAGALLTTVGNFPSYFVGKIDGYGHVLRNGQIEAPDTYDVGLIGYLGSGGILCNLGVELLSVEGKQYTGILAGVNWGTITSCYAKGMVQGDYGIGGLVGLNCNGTVTSCYAMGTVNGGTEGVYIGGLVGLNQNGTVTKCYAAGPVTGGSYVGGFAGANGGGTIQSCYWDKEVSGQLTSGGGEGRTTNDMTYPYASGTYVDWDFVTVWAADVSGAINNGYPYLRADIPHPADSNTDFQFVMSEAIACLAGWQQGANSMAYAIRAAYLWQNGEYYHYDSGEVPPLCWVPANAETEGESEINPWQNPVNPLDVNDDGVVSPQDVLVLTNDINANGSRTLPSPPISPPPPPPYLDVDGDGAVTPSDVLTVVNYLNANP